MAIEFNSPRTTPFHPLKLDDIRTRYGHAFPELTATYSPRDETTLVLGRHVSGMSLAFFILKDVTNVARLVFRTPAKDRSGDTHLYEHLPGDGSERYPVRGIYRFANYASLATIEARTLPDFTEYSCSSAHPASLEFGIDLIFDGAFRLAPNEQVFLTHRGYYRRTANSDGTISTRFQGTAFNEVEAASRSAARSEYAALLAHVIEGSSGGCYLGSIRQHAMSTLATMDRVREEFYVQPNALFLWTGDAGLESRLKVMERQLASLPECPHGRLQQVISGTAHTGRIVVPYPVASPSAIQGVTVALHWNFPIGMLTAREIELMSACAAVLSDPSCEIMKNCWATAGLAGAAPEEACFSFIPGHVSFGISIHGIHSVDVERSLAGLWSIVRTLATDGIAHDLLRRKLIQEARSDATQSEEPGFSVSTGKLAAYLWASGIAIENLLGAADRADELLAYLDSTPNGIQVFFTRFLPGGEFPAAEVISHPVQGVPEPLPPEDARETSIATSTERRRPHAFDTPHLFTIPEVSDAILPAPPHERTEYVTENVKLVNHAFDAPRGEGLVATYIDITNAPLTDAVSLQLIMDSIRAQRIASPAFQREYNSVVGSAGLTFAVDTVSFHGMRILVRRQATLGNDSREKVLETTFLPLTHGRFDDKVANQSTIRAAMTRLSKGITNPAELVQYLTYRVHEPVGHAARLEARMKGLAGWELLLKATRDEMLLTHAPIEAAERAIRAANLLVNVVAPHGKHVSTVNAVSRGLAGLRTQGAAETSPTIASEYPDREVWIVPTTSWCVVVFVPLPSTSFEAKHLAASLLDGPYFDRRIREDGFAYGASVTATATGLVFTTRENSDPEIAMEVIRAVPDFLRTSGERFLQAARVNFLRIHNAPRGPIEWAKRFSHFEAARSSTDRYHGFQENVLAIRPGDIRSIADDFEASFGRARIVAAGPDALVASTRWIDLSNCAVVNWTERLRDYR